MTGTPSEASGGEEAEKAGNGTENLHVMAIEDQSHAASSYMHAPHMCFIRCQEETACVALWSLSTTKCDLNLQTAR